MYPEGFSCDDIQASLSLRLPAKWQFATALKSEGNKDGLATFQTVSLTDLADCPLIAGEHLRTIPLATGPYPPAFLDVVSESPTALELSPKVIEHVQPGCQGGRQAHRRLPLSRLSFPGHLQRRSGIPGARAPDVEHRTACASET